MYRHAPALQVFLAHPGGPFWRNRDAGAWSLPKGEPEPDEDLLACAIREFEEETGLAPAPDYLPLGSVRQKGGKEVRAWAFEGAWEEGRALRSNAFEIEWPPRSGRRQSFPEIDRVAWFDLDEARERLNPAQAVFVERLAEALE